MSDTGDQDPAAPGGGQVFRPGLGNALAGVVSALALLAAAAALVARSAWLVYAGGGRPPPQTRGDGSPDWAGVVMMAVVGLGLAAGAALLRYARWLLAHRVEVRPDGFRYGAGASADEVPWSDVVLIRELIRYERSPVLKFPARLLLPKLDRTSYAVTTAGGKAYYFGVNSVRGIRRFGAALREQATRSGVRWETVEQDD